MLSHSDFSTFLNATGDGHVRWLERHSVALYPQKSDANAAQNVLLTFSHISLYSHLVWVVTGKLFLYHLRYPDVGLLAQWPHLLSATAVLSSTNCWTSSPFCVFFIQMADYPCSQPWAVTWINNVIDPRACIKVDDNGSARQDSLSFTLPWAYLRSQRFLGNIALLLLAYRL